VSTLSLSALGAEGYAVVKLWLANHTTIAPLYLRVDVAAPPHCGEALAARVCMRFLPSLGAFPTAAVARREWETALAAELSAALGLPSASSASTSTSSASVSVSAAAPSTASASAASKGRVRVSVVQPIERIACVDLLPDQSALFSAASASTSTSTSASASASSPSSPSSAASASAASAVEGLPLALAERLQKLVLLSSPAASASASASAPAPAQSLRRGAFLAHV
jgi:hypothetical protein